MGLTADIYRSSRYDSEQNLCYGDSVVLLVNVSGPTEPEDTSAMPCLLLPGNVPGSVKVVPAILDATDEWAAYDDPACKPAMFGGTYVSGDSRFSRAVEALLGHPWYGAVALHDRMERW